MDKSYKSDGTRFVITPQGHRDWLAGELCKCRPKLMGLLVACEECGTVYGSVRESSGWGQGRPEYKGR